MEILEENRQIPIQYDVYIQVQHRRDIRGEVGENGRLQGLERKKFGKFNSCDDQFSKFLF